MTILERLFYFRVVNKNGCWIWPNGKNTSGYGQIGIDGKVYTVHRLLYKLMFPWKFNPELKVCHTCDNPACYNWGHLWQGTHRENMKDSSKKGRQLGSKGHKRDDKEHNCG